MASSSATTARAALPAPTSRRRGLAALTFVPFVLLLLGFLIVPAVLIAWGSFHDAKTGELTLHNYAFLGEPTGLRPFINSLGLSTTSTIAGGVFGLLIAQAMLASRSERIRDIATTFASVAANFAGVPLAFAFITI